MNKPYPFREIGDMLRGDQNVVVALTSGASFDQVASALSLSLGLAKMGKKVNTLSPEPMRVEFSHLVGLDKVQDVPSAQDLTLTIDLPLENIDKITSNDEGGKLNLVIKAKPGMPPVEKEKIIFTSGETQADLIFTIGAKKLEDLGKIYQENRELFSGKPIVNLDWQSQNGRFGPVVVFDLQASSFSEITTALLDGLRIQFDPDISSNLFLGLSRATDNFQKSNVTADTFEAAAICLRRGAKKLSQQPIAGDEKVQEEISQTPQTPSPDWFEPKILKSSNV